jgi:flagellar motor switch protein FliM
MSDVPPADVSEPYDFARPERVPRRVLERLQALHVPAARGIAAGLTDLLGSIAEVRLLGIEPLLYADLVAQIAEPACVHVLEAQPLNGPWQLEISPKLLFPIVDRLLGGELSADAAVTRPLSAIELRIVRRVTQLVLDQLERTWQPVVSLALQSERVESDPARLRLLPPAETVVGIALEVSMEGIVGLVRLALPFADIERLGLALTGSAGLAYKSPSSATRPAAHLARRLEQSRAEVRVTLSRSTVKTLDMFDLQVGDIISTEKDAREPLEVEVGGVLKFLASPGLFKGRKAIQIGQVLTTPAVGGGAG